MVDPVSLGVAAVALMASKFGDEFASAAATSSWRAVRRLREVIAGKFGHAPETGTAIAALSETSTLQDRTAAAELIASAARSDPEFAAEVQRLVATARQDRAIETFVAQAYDNAKQVNIRGDNIGTISLG
ncbi:hypothetical protein [Nocardia sp. NPDC005998]|uniref:hypothetical protein n=1 Tax=Nocardia sp. NPDC005998 TaxID=3156894 RepID=UPI0033B93390